MKLSPLEQKIFMNIQLGVICMDKVDFHRPDHILDDTVQCVNTSWFGRFWEMEIRIFVPSLPAIHTHAQLFFVVHLFWARSRVSLLLCR